MVSFQDKNLDFYNELISMIKGVWITTMLLVIMLHLWLPHRALPDSIQKQVLHFDC
jgi:hypothetical protein